MRERPYLLAEVASTGGRLVLRLVGELDVNTARHASDLMLAALQASDGGQLDVDLSALMFCDSTGAQTLMAVQRSARTRGGEVRLINAHERLWRIFRALGFADALGEMAS